MFGQSRWSHSWGWEGKSSRRNERWAIIFQWRSRNILRTFEARGRPREGFEMGTIDSKGVSAGLHHENAMKSRRHARRAVWWRRRELNPGPKTVSATDLHV